MAQDLIDENPDTCAEWQRLSDAVRSDIVAGLGVPRRVAIIGPGKEHMNRRVAGRLTTDRGTFFFKVSPPYEENSFVFDYVQDQIKSEWALPLDYPAPQLRASGAGYGKTAMAWLAHDWLKGQTAAEAYRQKRPGTTKRVLAVVERSFVPVDEATSAEAFRDATADIDDLTEAIQQICESERIKDLGEAGVWLRSHKDQLVRLERGYQEALERDPHVLLHNDLTLDNVFLGPSASDDLLIDGAYERGPAWLALANLGSSARRAGYPLEKELDEASARFGGTPDLLTAYTANRLFDDLRGQLIHPRRKLELGEDQEYLLGYLRERVEAAKAARPSRVRSTMGRGTPPSPVVPGRVGAPDTTEKRFRHTMGR